MGPAVLLLARVGAHPTPVLAPAACSLWAQLMHLASCFLCESCDVLGINLKQQQAVER